jgi:uncharacterized protein (TIGR01777 family)
MKIVISGGTGFLGQPLASALARDGHSVAILSRAPSGGTTSGGARVLSWTPDGTAAATWAADIDDADAVINLAGEPIAARRWTAAQKQRILDSRVLATRSLAEAVQRASRPPAVFVSGSAVGYYGPLQDQIVTEETPPGDDFLARVCVRWEAEAMRAASARTRVVCVRTGLVLERNGGALPQMLPPFRFGVGGPVGSGRQYWPWIHRQDWIDLVRFALATSGVSGPMNASAPHPARSVEFAKALGRAMHRPALLPAPGFALKLLLGEMADGLLLSGQRAIPAKAQSHGYTFAFADLDRALRAIFVTSP